MPVRAVRLLGLVVAALAFAVGAATACGEARQAKTIEVIVPAGTGERLARDETVTVMPERIELRVGDTLLIRNEDAVDQSVGPYFVKAGLEVKLKYGKAGHFEGYCPLTEGERYEIVVTE